MNSYVISGTIVQESNDAVTWDSIHGNLADAEELVAALGGVQFGGASDLTITSYDTPGTGVVLQVIIDGLTWNLTWVNGRFTTATCGSLVREFIYDGAGRFTGVNGVRIQAGALILTHAQMSSLTPSTAGCKVKLTDVYPGTELIYDGAGVWRSPCGRFRVAASGVQRILHGCSAATATYSQTGNTVTITLTAHGLTAQNDNGSAFHVTPSSGALATGWLSNVTYVDANTFTCTSSVSQTTSGNLGTQVAEVTVDSLTLKGKSLGPHGELQGWFLTTAAANNANAKTLRLKLAGTTVFNPSLASTLTFQAPFRLQNRGVTNKQIGYGTNSTSQNGSTSAGANPYTIDTEVDVTILITMQLATNTDCMKLCGYSLDVQQG